MTKFITKNRYFLSTLLVFILFSGCAENKTSKDKRKNESQQRIYGKEATSFNGREYHIIEVDGVEYITSYGGGICPLVKNESQQRIYGNNR